MALNAASSVGLTDEQNERLNDVQTVVDLLAEPAGIEDIEFEVPIADDVASHAAF
jgi:hypothetical protein